MYLHYKIHRCSNWPISGKRAYSRVTDMEDGIPSLLGMPGACSSGHLLISYPSFIESYHEFSSLICTVIPHGTKPSKDKQGNTLNFYLKL